jgi:hypothetical protein
MMDAISLLFHKIHSYTTTRYTLHIPPPPPPDKKTQEQTDDDDDDDDDDAMQYESQQNGWMI